MEYKMDGERTVKHERRLISSFDDQWSNIFTFIIKTKYTRVAKCWLFYSRLVYTKKSYICYANLPKVVFIWPNWMSSQTFHSKLQIFLHKFIRHNHDISHIRSIKSWFGRSYSCFLNPVELLEEENISIVWKMCKMRKTGITFGDICPTQSDKCVGEMRLNNVK